jgi:hypothetical protein
MVGYCENKEMLTAWVIKKLRVIKEWLYGVENHSVTIMVNNQWLPVTEIGFLRRSLHSSLAKGEAMVIATRGDAGSPDVLFGKPNVK